MRALAPTNVARPRSAGPLRALPRARSGAARAAALAGFSAALLAPAPSQGTDAAAPPGAPPSAAARSVAVVDAWVGSGPPTLGVLVTERAIARARALGYAPLDPLVVRRVHVSLQRPGRLDPPALAEVARRSGAALALVVSVEPTERGEQRVTLECNDSSGSQPRVYSVTTTADELGGAVDTLVRAVLPEVSGAATPSTPAPPPPRPGVAETPREHAPGRPPSEPWRLALALDTAFGLPGDGFRNHLLGPRLDRRFSETVSLGFALSYANLTGPSGRVSNVLPAVSLEWRPALTRQVAVPLRYTGGYLRNNGPVVQLAVGLSVVTGSVELAFLPVAPTLWVTKDQPVVSLDLLAELGLRF